MSIMQEMSKLPSYDASVRSSGTKKEFLDTVAEAVGDYLEVNEPTIRDNVKKEITQLAYTFTAIEDDFAKITPEILKLDESKVLRKLHYKDWQDLHDTYTSLTDESRSAAIKIKSAIGELTGAILPALKQCKCADVGEAIQGLTQKILPALKYSSVRSAAGILSGTILPCLTDSESTADDVELAITGLNEKILPALVNSRSATGELTDNILPALEAFENAKELKEAFEEHLKGLEAFQSKSQEIKNRFLRLKQGISNFRMELEHDVKNEEQELVAGIARVNRRIAQLEDDLTTTSAFFTECGDALDWEREKEDNANTFRTAMATAGCLGMIQGTACLATIAPGVGIGMLVTGLRAIGSNEDADRAEEYAIQHDKNLVELCELTLSSGRYSLQERQLVEACEMLDTHRPIFDGMCDRMKALHGIWQMLWADCQVLLDRVLKMTTSNSRLIKKFAEQGIKPVYETLHWALDQFVIAYGEAYEIRKERESRDEC